ncbi:hypothetical protein ACFX2A_008812 [Malus domestica]
MDLDGRIGFSKFPKLRTSKSPHQGEIGKGMSDLGVRSLVAHSLASIAKWLNPNDAMDTRGWGDFDIIKDQGLNHKTNVMPQVKGLLCIIPTMSSHVT